ncbi:hypothetical protein [Actinopolymorpha pittospori]|uniref:Uncharacterized protein n=1 Tax=Actinopolymorpha pittospori TaxID=648752 RepID=A0A927RE10_9ACTN|nr:hypothetical protein [Actinopolymorpha pittospori]MBE1608700.1 hypothetical protein [Actinopolymorpha pittospori]
MSEQYQLAQPMQGQSQASSSTQQPKKPKSPKRTGFLGSTALIVALGLAALTTGCAGNDGDMTTESVATSSPDATVTSVATPSPVVTPSPVATPTHTSAAPTKHGPGLYSGRGDQVLSLTKPSDIGFADITHEGSGDFKVEIVESQEALIYTTGPYSGRVLLDFGDDDTTRLKITTDGTWAVKALPLESISSLDNRETVHGRGDDVLVYIGAEAAAKVEHIGEGDFAVQAYAKGGLDMLVNETSNFKGEVQLPEPSIIQVTGDGLWSITPE